jgi:hypothetical protein
MDFCGGVQMELVAASKWCSFFGDGTGRADGGVLRWRSDGGVLLWRHSDGGVLLWLPSDGVLFR